MKDQCLDAFIVNAGPDDYALQRVDKVVGIVTYNKQTDAFSTEGVILPGTLYIKGTVYTLDSPDLPAEVHDSMKEGHASQAVVFRGNVHLVHPEEGDRVLLLLDKEGGDSTA